MSTNVILKNMENKLIYVRSNCHLDDHGIGSYQIDLKCCLKGVIQVDHEGAFAQSKRVSFCLHLPRHVFVNHVGFLHHLGIRKENVTIEKLTPDEETVEKKTSKPTLMAYKRALHFFLAR